MNNSGEAGAERLRPAGAGGGSDSERPIWTGTPSQWVNFWPFTLAAALVIGGSYASARLTEPLFLLVSVAGVLIAFWPWLTTRTTNIEVTTERISTRTGVFTRRKRDMELYRVKDTTLHEPFFLRLVSLANIEVVSSDKTTPFLVLPAIRDAEGLREQLRQNVERMRTEKRVRELDFE